MSRAGRWLAVLIVAAAAATLVLTVAGYLNRPLRGDEAEWPPQVQAVAHHGVPKVAFADDRVQHVNGYFGYDAHYGMWHPPLYQFALAAAFLAAGDADWVYRSVGVVCLAFAMWCVWRIAGDAGLAASPLARTLPVALPLFSPLVTEGSLFLDIDNTTLMASIALVIWRFLRPGDPYTAGRTSELALLLCLTLLSKLTTPFVLMASLALYAALGPRPLRGVVAVAAASIAGVALFAALYWGYCRLLDYPPRFMFDVSYLGKRNMYSSVKGLRDILFAVRWNIVWLPPAGALLVAAVMGRRLRRYRQIRSREPVDLLVIFSGATFFCYAVLGAMWGKYTAPAAFMGAAAAGLELGRTWPGVDIRRPAALLVALALFGALVGLAPIPYSRPPGTSAAAGLWALVVDPRNVSAAFSAAAALVVAGLAARRWITPRSAWPAGAAALAACLAVSAPVTTARLVTPRLDRGPFRPFDDRGFLETAEHLNRVAAPGAAIVAEKDFGRYFKGRVYPVDGLGRLVSPVVTSLTRRSDVRFLVDSAKYPLLAPSEWMAAADITRVEAIGDYRVYVKR